MPIATPEVYAQMLDAAKDFSFAYPAINVSSSQTLNAALKGFAAAGRDLDDAVGAGVGEPLEGGVEGLRGRHVDGRVGEGLLLRGVQHLCVHLGGGDGHRVLLGSGRTGAANPSGYRRVAPRRDVRLIL